MIPRLVVFDVDGTLVDSQAEILNAVRGAVFAEALSPPEAGQILSIVGLSLDRAMEVLLPFGQDAQRQRLVAAYKGEFQKARQTHGAGMSPLYPGAREVLNELSSRDDVLLGIATGKSRRGLDALLEAHELKSFFATEQVADHHPSKPHPSMLLACLDETGVEARHAAMVGDTSFDMEMAASAGFRGIGVSWGYHPIERLRPMASQIISQFTDLPNVLAELTETLA